MRARYVIGNDGAVNVTDRGLAYGDGLFETMLVRAGRVRRLNFHLDRLQLGCDRLALPLPDRSELVANIEAAVAATADGNLKLILTRGSGPRGYAPPPAPVPTVILLTSTDLPPEATALDVVTLQSRLGENVKLAGIKHLNRLEQVLARLELSDRDADEGLMLSTSGAVIGGTSRNLFAVFGESVMTPRVDRAGIAGVMRRTVLELCAESNITMSECDLAPRELAAADEVFMTNALVGIQSVGHLDGRALESCSIADGLRVALELREAGAAGG